MWRWNCSWNRSCCLTTSNSAQGRRYIVIIAMSRIGRAWSRSRGIRPLCLVAGHVVVTVPYVLRSVVAVYARANRETEEAAAVLGAPAYRVLWHVTLPIIRPGLIAGAMFAFLISFDEVAVALLMTTSDTTTLPVSILSYLVYNYDPSVAAISTIQIALVVGILLLLEKLVGLKSVMFTAR